MSATLIKQEANIEHHVKRSDSLEELVKITKTEVEEKIDAEIKRIDRLEKNIQPLMGFGKISMKILLIAGAIITIISGLVSLFS
jgi:hypothetical protein